MKTLIFKSITMLSIRDGKSRKINFHRGKNLIVGENHSGKSTIIKNIFIALGAIPKIPIGPKWDHNSFLDLDIELNQTNYTILHNDNLKGLFRDHELIGHATTDEQWSELFHKLTGFNLSILDGNKRTIPAPPRLFFLPYYLDQDSSWKESWNTFNKQTNFKNSIEYFTGKTPPTYYEIIFEKKKLKNEKGSYKNEINSIERAKDKFRKYISKQDTHFNQNDFNREIEELTNLVNELNKDQETLRQQLVDHNELISQIKYQIASVEQAIELYEHDLHYIVDDQKGIITCPVCKAQHKENFYAFLQHAENKRIIEELSIRLRNDCEIEIQNHDKLQNDYNKSLKRYFEIEQLLKKKRNKIQFKDIIESAGNKKALDSLNEETIKIRKSIGEVTERIEIQDQRLKQVSDPERSKYIINFFKEKYSESSIRLQVPSRVNQSSLTSRPKMGGSGGPRSILAYYSALWSTSRSKYGNFNIPIVVDSPNQNAQSREHLDIMIRFLSTALPKDNQVLIGSEINTDYEFDKKIIIDGEFSLLNENNFYDHQARYNILFKTVFENMHPEDYIE